MVGWTGHAREAMACTARLATFPVSAQGLESDVAGHLAIASSVAGRAGAHCRHPDGDEFSIRSHKRATAQSRQVVNTTIVNSVIIDSIPITTP